MTTITIPSGDDEEDEEVVVEPIETHTVITIDPGIVASLQIVEEEIAFTEISIDVKNPANNIQITVTKLAKKPATVVHSVRGRVYQYIQIDKENLEDDNIDQSVVKFKVEKASLKPNETAILNRYSAARGWEELPTVEIRRDINYVYYEATTSGFSVFAITMDFYLL